MSIGLRSRILSVFFTIWLSMFSLFSMRGQTGYKTSILDYQALVITKTKIKQGNAYYKPYYNALITSADSVLKLTTKTVMDKDVIASSGDKHDYMSMGIYWWPDPTKPDGLPYIRKDGQVNPEVRKITDAKNVKAMVNRIRILSLAYFYSDEVKYAAKALEITKAWFVDDTTKMNPNLNYAQGVPGKSTGRRYGIIETREFGLLMDHLVLVNTTDQWASIEKSVKNWLTDYLEWLENSELGRLESETINNHGTWYDVQVASISIFLGKYENAEKVLNRALKDRLNVQIQGDGSQPEELARTNALDYSAMNLLAFFELSKMSQHLQSKTIKKVEILNKLSKAFDFIVTALSDPEKWDHPQLINPKPGKYQEQVLQGAQLFKNSFYYSFLGKTEIPADILLSYPPDLPIAINKIVDQAQKNYMELDKKILADTLIPRILEKDKSIRFVKSKDWTSGFYAASLWNLYSLSKEEKWKEIAEKRLLPLEKQKANKGTHDLGFMIFTPYGNAYEITGNTTYKEIIVEAAKSLMKRYNPYAKSIKSWDWGDWGKNHPVIIDNMLNLELLFKATEFTGDSLYHQSAVAHANTTLKNHFRPDNSSFHVVVYNPETGEIMNKKTHQGYANDSDWTRGQAWGLYGYTLCYRFTKNNTYLDQAKKIAQFILNDPQIPDDGIPYWDRDDPSGNKAPRDASAAAINAAALLELSTYVTIDQGKEFWKASENILKSLSNEKYFCSKNECGGFLIDHSTGNWPKQDEVDVPIIYGDFYFLEALKRYISPFLTQNTEIHETPQ